ncbi:MAG: hypothetical protein AAGC74_02390 [Verrucomicrobiota bacterium]
MNEESLNPEDSFFEGLFEEAGWKDETISRPDARRVEEITQRAISETIMKESTSFLFLGFSTALQGIFAAFFGSISKNDEDYKP